MVAALQIGVISYAYEKMGVSEGWVTALLLGSLLGSYINIPIAELGGGQIVSHEAFSIFGVRHVLPVVHDWPGTILAINVGGAIIPTALSIYLMVKNQMFGRAVDRRGDRGAGRPLDGQADRGQGNRRADLRAADLVRAGGHDPLPPGGGSLGLRFGQPGNADRRRSDEPAPAGRAGRADRLDRRCRHVRRHLSDRAVGRAVGPLIARGHAIDRRRRTPRGRPRSFAAPCSAVGKPSASSGKSNVTRSARSPTASVTASMPNASGRLDAGHGHGRGPIDAGIAHDADNARADRLAGPGQQIALAGDDQPAIVEDFQAGTVRCRSARGASRPSPTRSLTRTTRSGVLARTNVLTTAGGR